MPMPSLFRYFVIVGSVLLGLLMLVNYVVGPAPVTPAAAAMPKTVEHDRRASLIERWRDEQAARRAAERGEPVPAPVAATQVPEQIPPPAEPVRAEPTQIVAPVALQTRPAAAVPPTDEAAQAEKLKVAQVRKARIGRERARQKRQEEAASRQKDQFFSAQTRPAYAQGPAFNPFGFAQTR